MPRQLNLNALRNSPGQTNQTMTLPAARPPRATQVMQPDGSYVPGEPIPGEAMPGTLPHIDIPILEFPKIVYLHPKTPYKRMYLPVDGHGNKEWKWVANEAKTLKVENKEALEQALKSGYKTKHYVVPPEPLEDPTPDTSPEIA